MQFLPRSKHSTFPFEQSYTLYSVGQIDVCPTIDCARDTPTSEHNSGDINKLPQTYKSFKVLFVIRGRLTSI